MRTVVDAADGQTDDGNAADDPTVRANALKTKGADGADGADANFLSQSGSEKGVDDMELPEGADVRTIRGVRRKAGALFTDLDRVSEADLYDHTFQMKFISDRQNKEGVKIGPSSTDNPDD